MHGMKDSAEIPLHEKIQRIEILSALHLRDGLVEAPSRVQEETKAMARVVRIQLEGADKFLSRPRPTLDLYRQAVDGGAAERIVVSETAVSGR